jgi:hypothetical protein
MHEEWQGHARRQRALERLSAIYRIMGNRDVMVIDAGPRGSIDRP